MLNRQVIFHELYLKIVPPWLHIFLIKYEIPAFGMKIGVSDEQFWKTEFKITSCPFEAPFLNCAHFLEAKSAFKTIFIKLYT